MAEKRSIDRFLGINDVQKDRLAGDGYVRRQFGLRPGPEHSMQRVEGALVVATSGDSWPAVISLGNLHFRDQDAVVVHCLSTRLWIDAEDIDAEETAPDGIEEFGL